MTLPAPLSARDDDDTQGYGMGEFWNLKNDNLTCCVLKYKALWKLKKIIKINIRGTSCLDSLIYSFTHLGCFGYSCARLGHQCLWGGVWCSRWTLSCYKAVTNNTKSWCSLICSAKKETSNAWRSGSHNQPYQLWRSFVSEFKNIFHKTILILFNIRLYNWLTHNRVGKSFFFFEYYYRSNPLYLSSVPDVVHTDVALDLMWWPWEVLWLQVKQVL